MSKFNVKVDAVIDNNGKLGVVGTCDDLPFEAAPFRWGTKMLMKVTGDTAGNFTQGAKIAIGAAAKKALKAGGKTLPEAILVRPRKPKAQTEEAVSTASEAAPIEEQPENTEEEIESPASLDEAFASA